MNRKLLIGGIIVLILSLIISIQYSGILEPAAITGISKVTETDGTTYYYVSVSEYTNIAQEIRTDTMPKTNVDGTTSDGKEVTGTLQATFSIKQGKFVGWQTPLRSIDAGLWVSSVWAESGLIGRTIYSSTTPNFIYYQPSSGAMVLNDYVATVTVGGKTYSLPVVSHNNKGLHAIPGTDPVIYWEETSFGLSSSGQLPFVSSSHDVMEVTNNKVLLAQQGSVPKIIKIWNALFRDEIGVLTTLGTQGAWIDGPTYDYYDTASNLNKRIDLDDDNKYDIEVSDGKKSFIPTNVVTNTYQYRIHDMWPLPASDWYNFPDFNSVVLKSSVSTASLSNMKIIHNSVALAGYPNAIAEPSELIMLGRWKIPIDYGDITVKTYLPIPKIVSTTWATSSPVRPDGTDDLRVGIKNIGEDRGKINVWFTSTDANSLLILPPGQSITLDKGETDYLTFTFEGQGGIISETNAHIRVNAQGGKTTVTKDITKAVAPKINDDDETYTVKVTAVNKENTPLGNQFPIIVTQTNTKAYGVWIGELVAGSTQIKGEEVTVNGKLYYPENKEITISGDSEFYLVYTTTPPGDDDDEPNYLLYSVVIAMFILMVGTYIYFNKQEVRK